MSAIEKALKVLRYGNVSGINGEFMTDGDYAVEAEQELSKLRTTIDQLNIDLREVAPIIDLIIKHDKDAWPLAISWKRNYFRDIEFK
jgi:hypothetical protein